MLVKVDFEKAHDCVSWGFFRYMLVRMGFGARWRQWMEALIFNSSVSILVNGSPTEDFVVSSRGSSFPFSILVSGRRAFDYDEESCFGG